jgi:hypothetical protein
VAKNDRNFNDTTVETASRTAMRSSIDYNYATINISDENIDDIKLDNIGMMTIINANGSLTAFGDDDDIYHIILLRLGKPRQYSRPSDRRYSHVSSRYYTSSLTTFDRSNRSSFTPLLSIATSGGKLWQALLPLVLFLPQQLLLQPPEVATRG